MCLPDGCLVHVALRQEAPEGAQIEQRLNIITEGLVSHARHSRVGAGATKSFLKVAKDNGK